MNNTSKAMWQIHIENAASVVSTLYGQAVVKSIFQRYNAHGFYDLNPCNFSEVFADLKQIAND